MARFNVEFSEETLAVLEELARRQGTTKADVLRKAVHFEKWLSDSSEKGDKILVESGGNVRELLKF
jgi:hypothetical protein